MSTLFTLTPELTSLPALNSGESDWDARQQVLLIDVSFVSGTPARVLLRGWEGYFHWSLWQEGHWEIHDDPFESSLFPIEFFDHALLRAWREQVPPEVLALLRRYKSNPLGMLSIISRDVAAYQLFINQPTLFGLLHHQAGLQQRGVDWLLNQCRLKRTAIVKACGLPERPSVVKLLGKCVFPRYLPWHYDLIAQVFQWECSALNHQPVIGEALLNFVVHYPLLLESGLLAHWRDKDAMTLRGVLKDIEQMQQHSQLAPEQVQQPMQRCRCLADVVKLHDRLVRQIQTLANDAKAQPYPPPPLAGHKTIVPITDFAGLRIEGLQQHHCVESYHTRISNGHYYVYQVLAPERATLGVNINRDLSGRVDLSMDQLKGLQNKPVSRETTQAVRAWLTGRRN